MMIIKTYNKLFKFATTVVKNWAFVFLGILFVLVIALYLILCLPIFLYRWVITQLVAPRFGKDLGKAVQVNANALTADFFTLERAPRGTIVVNLLIQGHYTFEEFCERVKSQWVYAKDDQGQLKYPEFQQYIESWGGFMFWKQDTKFDIKNHVHCHKIEENASEAEAEQQFQKLNEDLLNKCYIPKRSPWEVQLVQNYKNSALLPPTKEAPETIPALTVIVLRIHHAMSDGFGVMHLLMEQLAGEYEQHPVWATNAHKKSSVSLWNRFISAVRFPWQVFREAGVLAFLGLKRKTLYHIPDRKKSWRQIYGRAPLLNVWKIKFIKNAFGVSFAAVVNSCLTAGLAKLLEKLTKEKLGETSIPKELMFANALPASAHPKKLRHNALAIAFAVPIRPDMSPVKRLRKCEKLIRKAQNSPMAMLTGIGLTIFAGNLAFLSRYILRNRYVASAATSFPGPSRPMQFNGKNKLVAVDFSAGALNGVAGVGFMCLSNSDQFRVCVTAENAVLSREEVNQLLSYVQEEFEALYEVAKTIGPSGGEEKV